MVARNERWHVAAASSGETVTERASERASGRRTTGDGNSEGRIVGGRVLQQRTQDVDLALDGARKVLHLLEQLLQLGTQLQDVGIRAVLEWNQRATSGGRCRRGGGG